MPIISAGKMFPCVMRAPAGAGRAGAPSNDANCAALGEVFAGAAKGRQKCHHDYPRDRSRRRCYPQWEKFTKGILVPALRWAIPPSFLAESPCTCGQRGCLEAYASATGLLRQRHRAELAHPETAMKRFNPADGSAPFICAAEGDETAKAVVEQYITHVGAGIVNFVNIFAPEVVLIGGGVSNAGRPRSVRSMTMSGRTAMVATGTHHLSHPPGSAGRRCRHHRSGLP